MDEKSEIIPVKVSPALKRRLETVAEAEGTTVSGFIRNTVMTVLEDASGLTPLGATKLQKTIFWSSFAQMSLALENRMFNLLQLLGIAGRVGRKGDAEKYSKMLEDAEKDLHWIDKAMKLIGENKWSEFYSYIEKGYDELLRTA